MLPDPQTCARLFAALTALVIVFQCALAAGAPWGHLAMGGKFPGRLPVPMRLACLLQIAVLWLLAAVVWCRAGLGWPQWQPLAHNAIWGVVGFSVLSVALNLATPSKAERRLWAPVAIGLALASLRVALA